MAFTMSVAEVIAADKSGLLGKHESWERIKLSDVATILNGAPFDSAFFNRTSGTPLIRIRDILEGDTDTYYTGSYDESFLVKTGDLLVGMDGDFNSAFWGERDALLNQRVCKIDVDEKKFNKKFLAFALPGYLSAINENTSSVTVKHLSSKTIGEIELPLPPFAEQARIVAKLEELLSDLDSGILELKAAQKKLIKYRQSLLKVAFEGALTAEWRAKQPQEVERERGAQLLERILAGRRARWETKQLAKFSEQGKKPPKDWQKKYIEPVQANSHELPQLPKNWVWASAEQICEFITKGTTPSKGKGDGNEKNIPFLRVTNLTNNGKIDLTDKVFIDIETHQGFLSRSIVYPNDILMNIVGPPLGQVSLVPDSYKEWNINQAIAIFRAVDGVLPLFICSYLLSPIAQKWLKERSKTTAGQTNLTLEVCRNLPIPLPTLKEQSQINSLLELICGAIESQEIAINNAIRQSITQRQNILHSAFSGELLPQDLSDEPAGVLLERIRAERVQVQKVATKNHSHNSRATSVNKQ